MLEVVVKAQWRNFRAMAPKFGSKLTQIGAKSNGKRFIIVHLCVQSAFQRRLKSIESVSTLTRIEANAFNRRSSLRRIYIPASV
jgi:hypothetical protein